FFFFLVCENNGSPIPERDPVSVDLLSPRIERGSYETKVSAWEFTLRERRGWLIGLKRRCLCSSVSICYCASPSLMGKKGSGPYQFSQSPTEISFFSKKRKCPSAKTLSPKSQIKLEQLQS
ncbi:hypothetical protein BC937DRAFT_93403, partial [Endogone sp. FLAS-F59071]